MFLYWKKRGAYELEASPPSPAPERYCWSSALDASPNLPGFSFHQRSSFFPLRRSDEFQLIREGKRESQQDMSKLEKRRSFGRCFCAKRITGSVSSFPIKRAMLRMSHRNETGTDTAGLSYLPSSLFLLSFSFLHDKPVQEEDWVVCQHPECPDRRRASKVRRGSPKVNLTVLQS
ncbi:unnamed protein product [Tetraodon nigroviridis]|uniref:(spotted green pufferfish) hypothetical protein n=1 Tax=Tetraodon nigroviridis TaxID=99883 RepID=Q4S677_TETNG|nr:unnamed protein product [Tetraodon nigroviridis]